MELLFILAAGVLKIVPAISAKSLLDIPSGLLIGTSISAYQHEGAWNVSDKALSRMDYKYNYRPTADFYHKYEEDIHLLKDIGFDSFRFSISWSRLLPKGTPNYISKDGLRFYNNILNELKERGIKPIVTIYYSDHPQLLEKKGGWLNEKMVYWFAKYSRVVFDKFGDRVKYFVTINEPNIYCSFLKSPDTPTEVARYKCHQNMMKAHALAYHIYDKEFRHRQNGQVGIMDLCNAYYPYSKNEKDLEARDIAHEFNCGWTFHPIFSGDYPEIMKTRIAERSRLQGYNESRLPEFSRKWIDKIKNSSDFLGLAHYASVITEQSIENPLSWPNDEGIKYIKPPAWPESLRNFSNIVPQGFGEVLRKIRDKYNNIPVYVLENGLALEDGVDDYSRIQYLHSYMKEMLVSITRDKCDVRMYLVWSFIDGFEFHNPKTRYGIVQVDFNDTNRIRTPRKSASWFKAILAARKLLPADHY